MPSKMAGNKDSASSPPDACGTTRLQRNLAEKQRRDKLNGYISELATIVPMVSMASKRLDKTSILRLSAAHLRISQSFLGNNRKRRKNSFKWRPNQFSTEQIREILESIEGFLLVTTTNGKIMYVSHSVEKFLGHQNIEMIGHTIFSFIHPSDTDMVRDQLKTLSSAAAEKNGSSKSSRCSFYCRLRERNQPRSDVTSYQFVHLVGHMNFENDGEDDSDSMEDDDKSSKASSLLNPVLKAFIRVVHPNPYNELSLTDAIENEYVTRHSPEGLIVFADHRLSTITGHLPHEVYGMSAYEYIREEDTHIALFAHKLMFANNGGTGLIVYRLRTRNGDFVYLKSTGYLQFGKTSTQIDHFVCVNRQLTDDEGEKELKKFRDHFTPHIRDTSSSSLYEAIKSIKGAITCPTYTDMSTTNNLDVSMLKVEQVDLEMATPLENNTSEDMDHEETKQNGILTGLKINSSPANKRLAETISLETNLSGRILANCSPLTESSLSANSPQSEDTCTPSPGFVMEGVYTAYDASSSSELCSNASIPQVFDGGNQMLCSISDSSFSLDASPLPLEAVQQMNIYTEGDSCHILCGPLIVGEDISDSSGNLWSEALGTNDCQSELSLVTPPHSSGEESGKNVENGC